MATTDTIDDLRSAVETAIEIAGGELITAEMSRQEVSAHGVLTRFDCRVAVSGSEMAVPVFAESPGSRVERDGVTRVGDGEHVVDVWMYPADPALPALPTVTTPGAADIVLQRLGIDARHPRLTVVAYRPGKRAVVRVDAVDSTLFVKIVAPAIAQSLHEKHCRWSGAGLPVPRSVGWSSYGLVALEALPGVEAASRVADSNADALLDFVDEVARGIARVAEPAPARASLASRLDWYVPAVSALAPHSALEVEQLAAQVTAVLTDHPYRDEQVVHGDLHLAQLLVPATGDLTLQGLLDIDTSGVGDPADDRAALIAHALATASVSRALPDRAAPWTLLAETALERVRSDHRDTGRRTGAIVAVHLLGHALAGAVPVEDALVLAHRVLDERPLTVVS